MRITLRRLGRMVSGFALILLAIQIKKFDATSLSFEQEICKSSGAFLCDLTTFSFTTIGLGAIWTLFLLVGVYYLLIYDWIIGFVNEVTNNALEESVNIPTIADSHMRNHRMTKAELRYLFLSIFENYEGYCDPEGRKLGGFVAGKVLQKNSGVIWRKNYTITITIEDPQDKDLKSLYYSWNQKNVFTWVGKKGQFTNFRYFNKITCLPEMVPTLIENLFYRIKIGSQEETSLSAHLDRAAIARIISRKRWTANGFSIEYDGSNLAVYYRKEVVLQEDDALVTVDENSLITRDDKLFVQSLSENTCGIVFNFEVPQGSSIVSCSSSLDHYREASAQPTPQPKDLKIDHNGRRANIKSDSWIFPGITAVVAWK